MLRLSRLFEVRPLDVVLVVQPAPAAGLPDAECRELAVPGDRKPGVTVTTAPAAAAPARTNTEPP